SATPLGYARPRCAPQLPCAKPRSATPPGSSRRLNGLPRRRAKPPNATPPKSAGPPSVRQPRFATSRGSSDNGCATSSRSCSSGWPEPIRPTTPDTTTTPDRTTTPDQAETASDRPRYLCHTGSIGPAEAMSEVVACGATGGRRSTIPHSLGRRAALRALQERQEATTFYHVCAPPLERGST